MSTVLNLSGPATNMIRSSPPRTTPCARAPHHLASPPSVGRGNGRNFPVLRASSSSQGASGAGGDGDEADASRRGELDGHRQRLDRIMQSPSISGRELRQLVYDKWGRSYDVRIHKRGSNTYLQVMWKFLEQQSFPLTEEEYQEQLDAVAYVLSEWGAADAARQGIAAARARGPGYTGGGGARAIAIPLDVDLSGKRGAEWGL